MELPGRVVETETAEWSGFRGALHRGGNRVHERRLRWLSKASVSIVILAALVENLLPHSIAEWLVMPLETSLPLNLIAAAMLAFHFRHRIGVNWPRGLSAAGLLLVWTPLARPLPVAPVALLSIVLLCGGALLLTFGVSRAAALSEWLAAIAVLVSGTPLLAFFFRVPDVEGIQQFTAISPSVAASLVLLGIGILFGDVAHGAGRVISSETASGRMVRWFLPTAFGGTLVVGFVIDLAGDAGLFGRQFAVPLFVELQIILLSFLIWRSASHLQEIDDERAAAEYELRERGTFWNVSEDLLCIAGVDGFFRKLNAAEWERKLGWNEETLLSRPFIDFVHPDDREDTLNELENLGRGHRTINFTNRYRCRDGSQRSLQWNAVPSDDRSKVFAVARDVSEMVAARSEVLYVNRRLKAVNEQLESFSYSISHDLRAPLRAIGGYAQMLEEDHSDALDDEARRYLQVIRSNVRKMGQLISDLLLFSRVSRQEIARIPLDVGKLAEEVFQSVSLEIAHDQKLVIDAGIPQSCADSALLRQVLENLLSNAIKYSEPKPGGTIRLSAETEDTRNRYIVTDQGVGFDPRYQDKLFGVFQRLHHSDEFEGTGVGLSIVRRIVERHGGEVGAESEPGKGSRFWFTLPVVDSDLQEGDCDDGR